MSRKELDGSGLVVWRKPGVDDEFEILAFVPDESVGFEALLAFFTAARDDLARYGKATRRLRALSRPPEVALLGARERAFRLVEHVELRADAARSASHIDVSDARVVFHLDAPGLEELLEATRLQAEPDDRYFHGSFTSWGFGYAIDWHGAE